MHILDHASWRVDEAVWGSHYYHACVQVSNEFDPLSNDPKLGKLSVYLNDDTLDDDLCKSGEER